MAPKVLTPKTSVRSSELDARNAVPFTAVSATAIWLSVNFDALVENPFSPAQPQITEVSNSNWVNCRGGGQNPQRDLTKLGRFERRVRWC